MFLHSFSPATRDMDPKLAMQLSKQYPHGFFEAVEALTFVTQSSWWTPLMMEITNPYFHNLWDTTMCTYVRQKVKGGVVNPPSRAFLFAPFNCTPLHKVSMCVCGAGVLYAHNENCFLQGHSVTMLILIAFLLKVKVVIPALGPTCGRGFQVNCMWISFFSLSALAHNY